MYAKRRLKLIIDKHNTWAQERDMRKVCAGCRGGSDEDKYGEELCWRLMFTVGYTARG